MEEIQLPEFEQVFVASLIRDREVSVPLIPADSYVDSLDRTRDFITNLISSSELASIGGLAIIRSARFTEEMGWHYWVRVNDRRES